MGIYIVGEKELVEKMAEALDNIEGDFSNRILKDALKKMKEYPYTSNGGSDKQWRKYLQ